MTRRRVAKPQAGQPRTLTYRESTRPVESMLWGRAADRCEFEGYNQPLYKSKVTQEPVNAAQKAHIYAFSTGGTQHSISGGPLPGVVKRLAFVALRRDLGAARGLYNGASLPT